MMCWPERKGKPAPLDSDGDGMSDAWEVAHGLNPRDPGDANAIDPATGYTQLERYLNGLVVHIIR